MDKDTSLWNDLIKQQSAEESLELKFVEIRRIPRKIDGKTLASLIVSASRVVPVSIDIQAKEYNRGFSEQIALVEFKSEREAHQAVTKIKSSSYGKQWHFDLKKDPKLVDPLVDMVASWIR